MPHRVAYIGGQIEGAYPPAATIRITSLDDPPRAVPDATAPDEAGYFLFDSLVAGRYRIELVAGGSILDQHDAQLVPGKELPITLRASD